MKFALRTGLMLRSGERQLELSRLLPDGDVQLEDVLTRRSLVMRESDLVKQVWTGRIEIVPQSGAGAVVRDRVCGEGIQAIDLSLINEAWRKQIEYRLRYLKGLQAGHVPPGSRVRVEVVVSSIAKSLGDTSPPSASTVMEWARRLRRGEGSPLSLLDRNKVRATERRKPDLVEKIIAQTVRQEYLTRQRHSMRHTHDCITRELRLAIQNGELAEEQGTVSLATLSRRIKDVDTYRLIASREGDARARMVMRTAMDGTKASYPLQKVEVDHTPLDWVVICDDTGLPLGRPWLTVAIDAYSYYVLGLYLSFFAPSVTSVVGVLRNSVTPKDDLMARLGLKSPWLSHGLADEWVLDNGMEFHAKAVQHVMWTLAVDATYCRVRTPWLKPHVERFFAELNYLTVGRGRVHKAMANVVNVNPYKDATVSFGDLVKGLTMFVAEVHPLQVNQRKLARPLDLFQEGLERCPPAIYPGDWDQVRLVSGLSKHLTVGPGGLELHGIPYGSAELLPWRRELGPRFKAMCKWDPDDMSQLYVQHPLRQAEWLQCPSRWADYANGLSFNQHLMIRKFARQELRRKGAEEDLWAARMRLHDHWRDASRAKDRKNSLHAGRAAGLTSAGVFHQPAEERTQPLARPQPEQIVLASTPASGATDIPEFESFELGSGR